MRVAMGTMKREGKTVTWFKFSFAANKFVTQHPTMLERHQVTGGVSFARTI
jgi:hypothetical protein